MRRLGRDRSGVAAIEFAFASLAFVTFLLGVVEFSRAVWTGNALQYATEETGRYIIAHPAASDSEIRAYTTQQLMTVDTGAVTVTVSRDNAGGVEFVTVVTSIAFAPIAPFLATNLFSLNGRTRVPLAI